MAQQTWLGRMFGSLADVLAHKAWPFIEHLFASIALDEVHALAPIAEKAVASIAQELPALATGGHEVFLKALNSTVATTLQEAEATGLKVATASVVVAAQAALSNAQKALGQAAP